MKCIFLYTLLFCIAIAAYGQPKYFTKTIATNNGGGLQSSRNVFLLSGDTIILTGSEWFYPYTDFKPLVIKINSLGDTLASYHYPTLSQGLSLRCVTSLVHDNNMIISGQQDNYNTGGDNWISNSFFLKIGIDGTLKNFIVYDSLYMKQLTASIKMTTDNYCLLAGVAVPTPDSPAYADKSRQFLIKTDTAGNIIWQKYYTEGGHSRLLNIGYPAADNSGYYLIGYANLSYSTNPAFSDMIFIKTDTAGNVIYSEIWGDQEQEYPVEAIATPDGGLLVVGSMRPGQFGVEDGIARGRVVKLDANCGVDWFQSYFIGCSFSDIVTADDGNYVLGGGMYNPDPLLWDDDAMLVKIEPDGDVMWRRRYGTNQQNYLYDLAAMPDGGYMFVGRSDSIEIDRAFAYVVRTNCMGLLTEPSAAFSYQANADNNIVSFINQSQYAYPDSIDGGHYVWDFGDGSPPFVCGQGYGVCPDTVQHVYTQERMYNISLTAIVCQDTSVANIQLMPNTNNGGTAVGIVVPIANGNFIGKVCPNPANAQINIAYDLPKSEKGTFTLYDINGKLLKTQTFENKGTLQISTDSLMPGIYLYETQTSNGFIDKGKLVLMP